MAFPNCSGLVVLAHRPKCEDPGQFVYERRDYGTAMGNLSAIVTRIKVPRETQLDHAGNLLVRLP
jgi:hypothetical protein